MAMIFQDPMTSLNPVLTVERQLTEVIEAHTKLKHREAIDRSVELLELVGIPRRTPPPERLSRTSSPAGCGSE